MRNELESYTRLQQGLLNSLREQLKVDGSLASLPRSGELTFDGGIWKFTRHGTGARFEQRATGVVVDIHDEFEHPELFDAWRLRTYFGSLGKRGEKSLQKAVDVRGQPMEKALEQVLSTLSATGQVEQVGRHYRLA